MEIHHETTQTGETYGERQYQTTPTEAATSAHGCGDSSSSTRTGSHS